MTVGWLLDGARDGRIPAAGATPVQRATDAGRLTLEQTDAPARACPPLRTLTTRRLEKGEQLVVRGAVVVQAVPRVGPTPQPLPFGRGLLATAPFHALRAIAGPVVLRIAPSSFDAGLC